MAIDKRHDGRAIRGWGNRLGTRTAKNSIKTVFYNFGEFSYFFIALFIIQSMYWTLCFTLSTNIKREYDIVTSLYDYHMIIEGITQSQKAQIDNQLFIKSNQNATGYESYEISPPDAYNAYYTIKVRLKSPEQAEQFINYYIRGTGIEPEEVQISYTPLFTFAGQYLRGNIVGGVIAAVVMTALSAILLMVLYSVRVNNFKFLYGIYMTCGAGYKKLFSTAVWEMMVISATTLAASFLCSWLFARQIFAPDSDDVSLYVWMIPAVVFLNLASVFLAVRVPMRKMAQKPPIALISSQDNSNLVTSPRRSFIILGRIFPFKYELYSTWRFRRYIAIVLFTAVLFSSVFVGGIFIAKMSTQKLSSADPEITVYIDTGAVDFSGNSSDLYTPSDISLIMTMIGQQTIAPTSGVKRVLWENRTSALSIVSHILLDGDMVMNKSTYATTGGGTLGSDCAVNSFMFTVCDSQYIDYLAAEYDIEGDPYAVLTDSNKIIISDMLYGSKEFDFYPGNTVKISRLIKSIKSMPNRQYTNSVDILRDQLECYIFDYVEYEIAAVVHSNYEDGYILLGMNIDEYYNVTESKTISNSLMVWLDSDLSVLEAADVVNEIKYNLRYDLDNLFIEFSIENHNSVLNTKLLQMRRISPTIMVISFLLLALSPVVWFFSQILFFHKREKEIGLLRVFGADEKNLKGVYTISGAIMSSLSFAATLPLSILINYLVYKTLSYYLPKYGFAAGADYSFSVSWWALAVALAVSAACGFLSSYIPYRISRSRRERDYARHLSNEN